MKLSENGNYIVLQQAGEEANLMVNIFGEVYPIGATIYLSKDNALSAIERGLVRPKDDAEAVADEPDDSTEEGDVKLGDAQNKAVAKKAATETKPKAKKATK